METASKRSITERIQQTHKPATETSYTHSSANSCRSLRLQKTSQTRFKSVSLEEVSWFQTLPDKIQRKQFSHEEQQQYREHRQRKIVVLDAADEAIFKPSRRNRKYASQSSVNQQPLERAPLEATNDNIQMNKRELPTSIALAMAEQFRWMDEGNDLDQKLQLDNYHANLPDVVIPSAGSSIRPSFRRNMSINKIPFSRPNIPAPIRTASQSTSFSTSSSPMARGHSRAISLMSPRFSPEAEPARHSIDPNATHYQNPDARLKLRAYLASPQKFDEAIEFGFPSDQDVLDSSSDKESQVPKRRQGSDANKTFFNDDAGSLLEDDASIAEPESPVTPSEDTFQHQHSRRLSSSTVGHSECAHLGFRKPTLHKHAESYSLSSTGAREMTLRMTLTRSDLRAGDDMIYGWQGQAKKRVKTPPKNESPDALEQAPMRGPFDGEDGWGPMPKDDGMVRRLWNRVKPHRKTTFT